MEKEVRTLKSKKYGGIYQFDIVLGKGSQASVHKFIKDDGSVYATKITKIKDYLQTPDEERNAKRWKAIVRELVIMESLNSKYVIKPIEFIRTNNNLYLV